MIENYYKLFENIDGVEALYIVDLETLKIKSKIIDDNHNKTFALDTIKHLIRYLKSNRFKQILIETEVNIFLKNTPIENKIFVLITNNDIKLGGIFNILKQIK